MITNPMITADDYGLTEEVTNSILEAVDFGAVNNVSLFANGEAFDYAIQEHKKRHALGISVHLNLTEGKPVSPKEKVMWLINKEGLFKNSFLSLWCRYIFSRAKTRTLLKEQISIELENQIKKVRNAVGSNQVLRVDGHQHIHMLPFIFDQLMPIAAKEGIDSVRISDEPFFIAPPYRVYLSSGIIKHFLLNLLSRRNRKVANKFGIKTNQHILGVLHTGMMTTLPIKKGLLRFKKAISNKNSIEVIVHPGFTTDKSSKIWATFSKSRDWSSSVWRKRELDSIKQIGDFLAQMR